MNAYLVEAVAKDAEVEFHKSAIIIATHKNLARKQMQKLLPKSLVTFRLRTITLPGDVLPSVAAMLQ